MSGAVVVLAGVALWMYTTGARERSLPDTPDSITVWMCDRCGGRSHLTARQLDQWLNDTSRIQLGKSGRNMIFRCEACNEYSICRAAYCRLHDVHFVDEDSAGRHRDCPRCAPAPP